MMSQNVRDNHSINLSVTFKLIAKHIVFIKRTGVLKEGIPLHITCSLISGLVATTVSAPADVVKTRMLSQSASHGLEHKGAPPVYRGFMDCFIQIIGKEGPSKLFRGWVSIWFH